MKLTTSKEVEAANPRIIITINPENQKTQMVFEYTCPECAGHGCNRHNLSNRECSGGTVINTLDPSKLHQTFGAQASKIIMAISNLYNEVLDK